MDVSRARALCSVTLAVSAIAACSSSDVGGAGSGGSPSNDSGATAGGDLQRWVVVHEGEEGKTYTGRDWVPGDPLPPSRLETWSAREKIQRLEYTQEEVLDYQLNLLTEATLTGRDTPFTEDDVTMGETRPFPEAWDLIAQCMTEKGFPAVTTADGGFDYPTGTPESQASAHDAALVECFVATPPDPSGSHYFGYDRADILSVYYEYFTEALVPCLETIGYETDYEKPTREFFIDAAVNQVDSEEAANDPLRNWWPPNWTEGRPDANAACPPLPKDSQFME